MADAQNLSASYELHCPPLDDVVTVLRDGLKKDFSEVEVNVIECPDLREKPFGLAAQGICGSPRIADVGGPGNLTPIIRKDKFDLKLVCETCNMPNAFCIGPGAGPHRKVGVNSEMMANCCFGRSTVVNKTFIAKLDVVSGEPKQQAVPDQSTEFSLMANLLLTEGIPGKLLLNLKISKLGRQWGNLFAFCIPDTLGHSLQFSLFVANEDELDKLDVTCISNQASIPFRVIGLHRKFLPEAQKYVIRIKAKTRISEENFVSALRRCVAEKYGSKPVALGGVFLIKRGAAKLHVMPDFPTEPFASDEAVNTWIQYFEMKAPLVCLSVFHSYDPGYNLRMEHTHCFSDHGDAGHYHYDITPDQVEYEAYFQVAEHVYRIDQV